VRDLDDEGRLLWIPDSKTEAKSFSGGTFEPQGAGKLPGSSVELNGIEPSAS
jgi:hypothetical protein